MKIDCYGFICLLFSLFVSFSAFSQTSQFYLVSDKFLPEKYQSGIDKARKSIAKGERFLEKAEDAKKKLQHYQEQSSIKPLKLMSLKENVYLHQLKASSYFYDAHRTELKTLKRYLRKDFPIQFERIQEEVGQQFYRGSVLRKRGSEAVPNNSPLAFIREAVDYEKRALEEMERVYMFDKKLLTSMPAPDFETNIVPPETNELDKPTEKNALLKPEPHQAVEKTNVTKERTGVFFAIQFMATREPVSANRIRNVYAGSLPLTKSFSDGWHRYAVGRFETVNEATRLMKNEGIEGFVVAFEGNERISIRRARQLLDQ